jgi:hypothetical protein
MYLRYKTTTLRYYNTGNVLATQGALNQQSDREGGVLLLFVIDSATPLAVS